MKWLALVVGFLYAIPNCFWPTGLKVAIRNSMESELAQRELLGKGRRQCRKFGMPVAACWTIRSWLLLLNSFQEKSRGSGLDWVCRHVWYACMCLWTCFAPGVSICVFVMDVLKLFDNV